MQHKHTGDIMKKTAREKTPVEPKEETPQVSTLLPYNNYKEDLKEIKNLLKEITVQLSKLDYRGGF